MRARIVIYNPHTKAVLLIHQLKHGRNYWVVPGGGAKGLETPMQTAIREINEELQIKLQPAELQLLFSLAEQEQEFFFLARKVLMVTPQISGEEAERSSADNIYLPLWIKLKQLDEITLMPPAAAPKIQKLLF